MPKLDVNPQRTIADRGVTIIVIEHLSLVNDPAIREAYMGLA